MLRYLQVAFLLALSTFGESQTVFKTPSGAKYHLASCRMVNNVSKELSVSEAIQLGLEPCKICKPPILQMSSATSQKKANGQSNTVQCRGVTKAGNRCKHMTSIANGYCFQHNPDNN
ncbi:MAG: hypothetical protein IPL84_11185 [Chitinophagaceae bacterium]|nr:hypothetical protein [Chitinophagaceae bacterium]